MKTYYELITVENGYSELNAKDGCFLYLIQHAALLSLKEMGYINEIQCRQIDAELYEQYIERANLMAND